MPDIDPAVKALAAALTEVQGGKAESWERRTPLVLAALRASGWVLVNEERLAAALRDLGFVMAVARRYGKFNEAYWSQAAAAIIRELGGAKPEPEFCDYCPHAMFLHDEDGNCGCGLRCGDRKRGAS